MPGDDAQSRKAQLRAAFDRIVEDYDTAGPGCFAYFGQRLVDQVGIEPGQHVLDIACGRGALLFPAAERVGPEGRVIGIDISDGMVRAVNEDSLVRGTNARAHVMDAEQLDFPDEAFDRVLCGFGLMFFPHLDKALSTERRNYATSCA